MNPTTLKIGGAVAGAILFFGVLLPWLRPLGRLIPNTQAMVVTTREILVETEHLQKAVGDVQVNLSKVQRQDQLLAEQEQLMQETVVQLRRQEDLAQGASGLMNTLLAQERTTAELTARAAQAASGSMATVRANEAELQRLIAATARVHEGSGAIDRQMDSLLGEMAESAENFKVIARFKEALRRALERSSDWWR